MRLGVKGQDLPWPFQAESLDAEATGARDAALSVLMVLSMFARTWRPMALADKGGQGQVIRWGKLGGSLVEVG